MTAVALITTNNGKTLEVEDIAGEVVNVITQLQTPHCVVCGEVGYPNSAKEFIHNNGGSPYCPEPADRPLLVPLAPKVGKGTPFPSWTRRNSNIYMSGENKMVIEDTVVLAYNELVVSIEVDLLNETFRFTVKDQDQNVLASDTTYTFAFEEYDSLDDDYEEED